MCKANKKLPVPLNGRDSANFYLARKLNVNIGSVGNTGGVGNTGAVGNIGFVGNIGSFKVIPDFLVMIISEILDILVSLVMRN